MAEQSYDLMHKDDVVASLQLDDLSGAMRRMQAQRRSTRILLQWKPA